jgi:hypothetical protein
MPMPFVNLTAEFCDLRGLVGASKNQDFGLV